jgi:hypothetical protein
MEIEKIFYVYVDFRGDDGKPFYVGKGAEKRIKNLHRNPLHTNIKKKHGMVRKILFENLSENESFEREIQLIGELQTHIDHGNGGANFTLGGDGTSGYKHTEEQKEVKSKSVKKQWEDPEYREQMSESVKKKWEDPEYRKKMSESGKKMWEDPEFKKKMRETHKKRYEIPEAREKTSESLKKKCEDPDRKRKMSATSKKLWEDPEFRAKVLEKQRLGREKKRLEKLQQEV